MANTLENPLKIYRMDFQISISYIFVTCFIPYMVCSINKLVEIYNISYKWVQNFEGLYSMPLKSNIFKNDA